MKVDIDDYFETALGVLLVPIMTLMVALSLVIAFPFYAIGKLAKYCYKKIQVRRN